MNPRTGRKKTIKFNVILKDKIIMENKFFDYLTYLLAGLLVCRWLVESKFASIVMIIMKYQDSKRLNLNLNKLI
jgi:hypothetical protein